MAKELQMWANILLLIGGLVLAIPSLYEWLSSFANGVAWIQMAVGILSVVVALWLLFAKE